MLLIIGWVVVTVSVLGGFMYSGGNPVSLFVVGEYITIIGAGVGYVLGSANMSIIKSMMSKIVVALKGGIYKKEVYLDMIKALYELFMIAREQGMIGIEEHVTDPHASSVFKKYPSFIHNHHAIAFLQDNLRPIIDGKAKGPQIKESLDQQLDRFHDHNAQPLGILGKVGDAMPGIGIVAAVMGIVITMGSISGDKATIGHHVAAALVGTFLGILISYGYLQPLCNNLELLNHDEQAFYEIMSTIIISYAAGAPPIMAAENGRQGIPSDRQPSNEELETMLKALGKK